MKIGFAINEMRTEEAAYTTTRLALTLVQRGHEVWYVAMGDFKYDVDETIHAHAIRAPNQGLKALGGFFEQLSGPKAERADIDLGALDVLVLRNDPSTDQGSRSWAQTAGISFGRMATQRGVIVLNDPNGLAKALNKTYFQQFPEQVRPKTIITRSTQDIKAFAREQGGRIVIKPLQGSGGKGVFLVTSNSLSNLNQMVESVARDGYIIAQEYLPAAAEGDIRLFMMNGVPLRYKGRYAAFRRVRQGDDLRSNIHAGGSKAQAIIEPQHLALAEMVRPKLVQDGMFFVGLDIVGDKLMEINVFSPGGLGSAQSFEKVNFTHAVVDALERKVEYMSYYERNFDNVEMACL